ncbi:MAG TPA: DASS family sodium-coupled anion symporter [Syntrophomonas sp.]|nr:DASS family sodium-coupled anion symporter [Syntrophomonas sp.]
MKEDYQFNKKNALIFCLAVAVMLLIYFLPSPPDLHKGTEAIPLTHEGKAVCAVLIYAVILWITEALPFSVTAISLMIIITIMGVDSFGNVAKAGMGSTTILFLMGCMGISGAITVSGLANRIMLVILSRVGIRTDRILFAFIGVATLLSMWVTDMAVAAMLLPLGVSILQGCGCKPLQSNFGRALMIGIVWGALFGGTATPAGCGANVLAMQYVRDIAGLNVSFGQWMAVGVPGALIMWPVGWFLLMKFFPPEIKELTVKPESIKEDLVALGPLSRKEKNTVVVFFITVFLWLFGAKVGLDFDEAFVALIGFFLLFLPGLRVFDSWKDVSKEIDWGGLILIAGGISAGLMLASTGAARYAAWGALSGIGALHPILRVMAVLVMVELLKIFFSSNSVTGAVVLPLIVTLAVDLGMNPWVIAGPAGIATSMAFIMVTSSPTNVIPYSSGYFSIKDFAKVGIWMTVAGILIVTFSVAVFGKFAGMNIWM